MPLRAASNASVDTPVLTGCRSSGLNPDGTAAPAAYSWGATDYPHQPAVSFREYPQLAKQIRDTQVVRVDDVAALPEDMKADRERLEETEVKSFVAIPLIVGGDLVGVTTLAHRIGKRSWSDQDVNELRVLSDLFANYIYRLRSRRALDEALAGLQRATDRLEAENVYLRQEIELTQGFDEIIGQSDGVLHCLHLGRDGRRHADARSDPGRNRNR